MNEKLIVGLIGVATGFLGSVLNSWLQSRLKLDEATRTERWTAYKKLWTLTKRIPKWPRETQFTYVGLKDFSEKCRDWYFDEGGYHLSKPSRKAYGVMQDTVGAILEKHSAAEPMKPGHYDEVQRRCHKLRTQLTCDLHSRQRGAFSWFGV